MITIFHGDDIAASRKKYIELKSSSKNPIVLPGESLSLQQLNQSLQSEMLFSSDKDIFIENFFSKRKLITKEVKEIVGYVQKIENEQNIVFWESKKLTPTALKSFPKAKVDLFAIPQTLFGFIDEIQPNSGQRLINLFHSALAGSEPELIFFMMLRQIRILLALSLGSQIEETARLAPWQMGNLSRQLKNFSVQQLKKTYQKLFEIDLQQKTGGSSLTMTQAIDMFLLNL